MATTQQASLYAVGSASWRALPRVDTKPPNPGDTGSGYERVRSYEWRPHTSRRSKEDVYAYHHRLLAVAWLLPDDEHNGFLGLLDGMDVHHNAPEVDADVGIPWDNREDALEMIDHGDHSSLTNAERRAYAEEDKQRANTPDEPSTPTCGRCGDESGTLCESDDWSGQYCPQCAKQASDGAPIEVL